MMRNEQAFARQRTNGRIVRMPKFMLILASSLMFAVTSAHAQTYPDRPIQLVVAYPPGGATDIIGRFVAESLGELLGQRVFVENRGGASGMMGAGYVAKSAPDGYTLIIATATTHAVDPYLFKDVIPYDAIKDFTPISFVGYTPLVLVTHPSVPASSVQELIAYVKSKNGNISYADGGTGSVPHMAGELFSAMAGIKIQAVPYKGDAPATNDVVGGHLPYLFAHLPVALPLIKSGRLKALGVTTSKRSDFAPDIPTIAEQGLPGYEIVTWWGIFGPAGMPKDVIAKLNGALRDGLSRPETAKRFFTRGYVTSTNSPEEFAAFVGAENVKWGKIVVDTGMHPE
jgi:tripartite-type tricarboxylate transporter receptor subunit TctC